MPTMKRVATRKAPTAGDKKKNFTSIKVGQRIRSNADVQETCAEYTGEVKYADEYLVGVARDDGKKSKVHPEGWWLITVMHLDKKAWWEDGPPVACHECGTKTAKVRRTDAGLLCPECLAKLPVCGDCGTVFTKSNIKRAEALRKERQAGGGRPAKAKADKELVEFTHAGARKTLCVACFDKTFAFCSECGEIHTRKGMKVFNGSHVCKGCAKKVMVECSNCGAAVPRRVAFLMKDKRPLCHECCRRYKPAIQPQQAKSGTVASMRDAICKGCGTKSDKKKKSLTRGR